MGITKKNKAFIPVILFIIAASIVAVVYYAQDWSAKKKVSKIEIAGNELLTEKEVVSIVEDSVISKKKDDIDMISLAGLLEENSYIKNAYISFSGSESINIEIIERKPVAYLVKDNGELVFVDDDMAMMPFRIIDFRQNEIPLLRNILNDGKLDSLAMSNALNILNSIKKYKNEMYGEISEVIYESRDMFSFILKKHGLKVKAGNADDMKYKLFKLSKVMDLIYTDKDIYNSEYIDLRWEGQIVIRS